MHKYFNYFNPSKSLFLKNIKRTYTIKENHISNKINIDQKEYYKKYIELRSDVKSIPTQKMLDHISQCNYGDDAAGEDPTMNKLLKTLCEKFNKEAALFASTGRMANMIGILTNVSQGENIILGRRSHLNVLEIDSLKLLGMKITTNSQLDSKNKEAANYDPDQIFENDDNKFDLKEILIEEKKNFLTNFDNRENKYKNFEENLKNIENTRLICFENTHVYNGGVLFDMENFTKNVLPIKENYKTPKGEDLIFHLDGSRILNASVASKISPENLTKDFETLNICLSKGLGAPCGSVIFMKNKQYERAKEIRQALAGNMRQSGILAAPALIALEDYEERFENDHKNAKILNHGLSSIKGLLSPKPDSNIVTVYLDKEYLNYEIIEEFIKYLEIEFNILVLHINNKKYIRCVLHHQVSLDQVNLAIKGFEKTVEYFMNKK